MSLSITNYDSPIGPIAIHATDTAVSRVEFAGEQKEESEEERGDRSSSRTSTSMQPGAHPLLDEVRCQLAAYFAGDLRCFDLPLALDGTPFQRQVWQQLLSVDYGHTASYQDIAEAIGNSKAVRAVGAANGRNPSLHHCTLPSDYRQRQAAEADGVWGWSVAQGVVAAA